MKLFIYLLPLLLVVLGVLNYMFVAKDVVSTVLLLFFGMIAAIYNFIKRDTLFHC